MTGLIPWLANADEVLTDPSSSEDDVDVVLADGLRVDLAALPGSVAASQIDAVVLQRVIAAVAARRAAVAVELADLGRRRAELARSERAVAGYTSANSFAD
jgi:uncharacterized Zn finger protein